MKCGGCFLLPCILFLFFNGEYAVCTPLSIPNQDTSLSEQVSCFAGKRSTRSIDSLYLGSEDKQNDLRLEFQLADITSNLSSFDLRTFDSEGVIFYGDVGKDNWFVLGIREKKLEVQMSNSHGQMILSKWGPDVSDGKWRKVSVDSSINTIEVRVDGEVVVQLTHYVNTQHTPVSVSTLVIILGDLPEESNLQLLKPLQPTLDACMRNWAWVKKHTQALDMAMETDENRRCFEKEEPGSFFPVHGYAIFKPDLFQTSDNEMWGLSVRVSFRVRDGGGVIFSLHGAGSSTILTVNLDWQKQILAVTLFNKLTGSVMFPVDLCPSHWQFADILIQSNKLSLKAGEATSSWDIVPADLKALEERWIDPAADIYIGGLPDNSAKEASHFSGCLKITLQGKVIDLDKAHYKHPHVRSHSCPVGI
ncbi:vitamin K-dependent S-like [Pelobates cultripes]|uniref:Vitamin K-dependent S-like n=1 Tax=Pelobates cultripes TaxID=61616 RepID=A0AAD1VSW8_PELCU|nr:vitamin K-dependent S-like [Pelobates cultripes]